jgi:hypothetical protein
VRKVRYISTAIVVLKNTIIIILIIIIIPKLIGTVCYAVQQSARPDALHLHDVYGVYIFGYYRGSRDNSTAVSILLLYVIVCYYNASRSRANVTS